MKLRKISLKNIRSYKSQEISFPDGSVLLAGDIGSGKTSVLLAIEFALFGLQPGQRGSALLSSGENKGQVRLEMEIDDKYVIIERSLVRGKTISQENSSLTVNGETEELSVTELKTRVLKLINYPEEFLKKTNLLYRFTVYSPQEEMKEIILEDPETRLNILRHIFGISKYKNIRENALFIGIKMREESRLLNSEAKDIEAEKEKAQKSSENVRLLEKRIESSQIALEEKKSSRKKIEEELTNLEVKMAEKQNFEKEVEKTHIIMTTKAQQAAEQESRKRQFEKKILEAKNIFNQEYFNSILLNIEKKKEEIDNLNKKQIELSGKINSLLMREQETLDKKKRIFNIEICPTCLQNVPHVHKHNILNESEGLLARLKGEIKNLESEIASTNKEAGKCREELSNLTNEKSSLEILRIRTEEKQRAEKEIADLLKSIELLNKDIDFLKNHSSLMKKTILEFSKYESQFRQRQTELKSYFTEERKIDITIAELKKEKELTIQDIANIEKRIKEKEEIRKRADYLAKVEQWLSTDFLGLVSYIEKNIMLTLRQEFSKLFNTWFSMLTTEAFYVHLDENFTPVIMQSDYELDYAFLSGGERTAVALAYRLALNQLVNSLISNIKTKDLLILDEPTDGFSEQQLDKVRDIFEELSVEQLIIVSHEQKIESFVDNIIRFKKDAGASFVV